MEKFLESPDDVDARTTELNEQYSADLDNLYTALAEDYMDEAEDRFYACENKLRADEDDVKALHEKPTPDSEWDYAVDYTKSTFRTRMSEILERQAKQREMDADLVPQSEEYQQLSEFDSRDVTQLKDEFQENQELQREICATIAADDSSQ
ncbi:hypothetical protein K438DRAFT_1925090 [Mycena galopus ATCC 62051]|nr:hypothetical protein K438DRAFT_1925090 [Mycena galopus ATCC 62051]